jgi:hypothetical protein
MARTSKASPSELSHRPDSAHTSGVPILTVDGAAMLIGRTFNPANDAIQRLVEAAVLRQVNVGRRNRAYEAPDIIAAFTALERRLASPEGDTRMSTPERKVPERR